MDHSHYVPILKAKEGELRALRGFSPLSTGAFTPLMELVPKTQGSDWAKTILSLGKSWRHGDRIMIDVGIVDSGEGAVAKSIFDQALSANLRIIPVTTFGGTDTLQKQVRSVSKTTKDGLCLRVGDDDFLAGDFEGRITGFLKKLKAVPNEIDMLIDFREVTGRTAKRTIPVVKDILNSLPFLNDWRSVILASSSFPIDLHNFQRNSVTKIPRTEFLMWQEIRNVVERTPTFSDYTISHPELVKVEPKIMTISGSLRYTVEDGWLIFKGQSTKRVGYGQMTAIYKSVVNHPEFFGKDFSAGDAMILEGANKPSMTGSATTWRMIGTSHHISVVTNQLAT